MIENLKKKRIYISRIDLENDLYEVVPGVMNNLAKENNSKKGGVDFLQDAKLINMIKLSTSLSTYAINKIYNHERFECLKELVKLCNQ